MTLRRPGMLAPRPRPSAILIGLALLALTAGCERKVSRPACPPGERCLEYGNSSDPATLDPSKATGVIEAAVIDELIEGLAVSAADGSPAPGLATHWETSPDGLTWTLHLRPAVWSDGVPVTADDFVFTYRRMLDPKTGSSYAYMLYLLKNGKAVAAGKAPPQALGVTAVDAHTLRLTLEHPAPYLPQLLKHHSLYPVPAHVVQRWGDTWTRPGRYVGNGPYRLVSWKLGDYLRIEKNPLFHDAAKVCIDRIDFFPTQDKVSAERRVKRGELDVNNSIEANRVAFLRAKGGMAPFVHTHPYLSSVYLAFNVRDTPALKDIRVRRAIGMAIDRTFITDKLLRAGQVPSTSFVPGGIAGYVPAAERPRAPWADWPLAQRQAQARALLAQAGYGPGHRLALTMKIPNIQPSLAGQAIQADLALIGVKLTIALQDAQVAFQSMQAGDFQVGVVGWIADYDDPMTYLGLMKSDTGSQNYGGYANPAYDALLHHADKEPDAAVRAREMASAEQIMLDDAYVAPIYTGVNLNLVSPRITGWVDNAVDIHRALYLCMRP